MSSIRRRLSPTTFIALLALFVSLGGTSYAAITITGKNVKDGSLTGADVKNNKLTGRDITSLTGSDIRNGSVGSADVKTDSLTGGDIAESTLGKVPSAATADKATTATTSAQAANADTVDGKHASDLQTTAGSDRRSNDLVLTTSDATVLSATVTLAAPGHVTGIASVEAEGDGGNNDNMNCNMQIDAVEGVRQSVQMQANTVQQDATLALDQVSATVLPAGNHTVLVTCNRGVTAAATAQDRSLAVIATG